MTDILCARYIPPPLPSEVCELRAALREIMAILNAAEEARAGVRPHEMPMNLRRWRQTLARSEGLA